MGNKVTITYNGEDITRFFGEWGQIWLDSLPTLELTATAEDWQSGTAWIDPGRPWRIAPYVASRQSCLWRHSFDWRNRKRGHVAHRGTK